MLDILMQAKRDKASAARFLKRLLRKQTYMPSFAVTDKLASYNTPCKTLMPGATHVWDKYANNRAENSHQPTRIRERRMRDSNRRCMPSAF